MMMDEEEPEDSCLHVAAHESIGLNEKSKTLKRKTLGLVDRVVCPDQLHHLSNRLISADNLARSILGEELSYLGAKLKELGGGIWSLAERTGASDADFGTWTGAGESLRIPTDLVTFLRCSNGISIRWAVPLGSNVCDVGYLALNAVQDLVEMDSKPTDAIRAFELSHIPNVGKVGLVFFPSTEEIWFCDLSRDWHFVAKSFSDYMRLALVHFFLRGWEYGLTPIGFDPNTEQWLRLLSPDRLVIDMQRCRFENGTTMSNGNNLDEGGEDQEQKVKFELEKFDQIEKRQQTQQQPQPSSSQTTKKKRPQSGRRPASARPSSGRPTSARPQTSRHGRKSFK